MGKLPQKLDGSLFSPFQYSYIHLHPERKWPVFFKGMLFYGKSNALLILGKVTLVVARKSSGKGTFWLESLKVVLLYLLLYL